jgi:hypothetical protein
MKLIIHIFANREFLKLYKTVLFYSLLKLFLKLEQTKNILILKDAQKKSSKYFSYYR